MGLNPITTNKGSATGHGTGEALAQGAQNLSLPSRGTTAQKIMSIGSAELSSSVRTDTGNEPSRSASAALYRVLPGDNPSVIAERFKISLRELYAANPELEPSKLQPGQALRIPGDNRHFHIVQRGESLGAVAAANKVSLKDILEANPGVDPKNVQIGQAVYLPLSAPRTAPERSSTSSVHVIKAGETLSHIATSHKVSVRSLQEANPHLDPRRLTIGREVVIPQGGSAEPARIVEVPKREPPRVITRAEPLLSASLLSQDVGHSAEWRPIPIDPTLLDVRYVCPLSAEPPPNFFVSAMRSLGHEGGLTNNRNDVAHQGGVKVTNYGITGMAMAEYLKTVHGVEKTPNPEVLTEKIKALSYGEALDIYASNYWQDGYQAIDKRVAFLLFDWGILGGTRSTLMRVQEAIGAPRSGKMDGATVEAINKLDPDTICSKITQLRMDRHRERVAEVDARIKKWDEITRAGGSPGFERPRDQSGFLKGWLERAEAVQTYARSKEFSELTAVFERTGHQGADLMDPVRSGTISLKRYCDEPALVRMLQQRLTSVGYTVHEDGKFDKEMIAVVNFFQTHYNLPRQPSWGPNEMRILDALMVAKQLREQPRLAGVSGVPRQ